jgi:nitrogen fixation protein FixH
VLLWLVAFFGVVFGVNAVMIRFATSTFGGVETASSYAAGLAFSQNVKAAQEQDALHWKVDGKISRKADGEVDLVVTALTQDGKIIPGWTAQARLAHPADRRLDHEIALTRSGSDRAVGEVAADAGQWDLIIELSQDNGRVFRSRNRVTLR